MNTRLNLIVLSLVCGFAADRLYADAPLIRLERASNVKGPWQAILSDDLSAAADGGWVDPNTNAQSFYRLQIAQYDQAGGPAAVSVSEVSKEVVQIALQHLQSSPDEGWDSAVLGPVVYPVYSPTINGGKEPAYLEFKVIPGPTPGKPTSLFRSAPLDRSGELGYILVSLTQEDVPIPEFSTEGPTRVEKLRRLAKSSTVRAMRYSDAILVAEDAQGEPVANMGATPFQFPEAILQYYTNDLGSELEDGKFIKRSPIPNFTGLPYSSFQAFKQEYMQGKLYQSLRQYRSQAARLAWSLFQGKAPDLISVALKTETQILADRFIASFDLDDPTIASLQLVPKVKGLKTIGITNGSAMLHVVYPDGSGDFFLIQVGTGLRSIGLSGWGSWHTYYADSFDDQKRYSQEWDLSGCCSDGWSGCGPTAWAMFYGYWDDKGISSLIGGTGGTPLYNNSYVKECIQHVFDSVSTYCAGDQGATNPWEMDEGHQWATHQGDHISLSTSWGVPYLCSGPRNKAIHAIKDHGRPAIVGTGFYEHYPFAYGYKYREYTFWGVTWSTERYWKVNNGHANSSGTWVNASSCWFGADGYCY